MNSRLQNPISLRTNIVPSLYFHLMQHLTRSSHSTSTGTLAGIIIACIFVVIAIKRAVWYSCAVCRRKREQKIDQETRVVGEFQGGWAELPPVKVGDDEGEGEGKDGKDGVLGGSGEEEAKSNVVTYQVVDIDTLHPTASPAKTASSELAVALFDYRSGRAGISILRRGISFAL